ncbi:hypothetical protein OIO90_000041 [Microbotryomycetes sp. JL221]|nr:hypothetical protein OIO90_000041 [Microbotryomycetes sp. JL221]
MVRHTSSISPPHAHSTPVASSAIPRHAQSEVDLDFGGLMQGTSQATAGTTPRANGNERRSSNNDVHFYRGDDPESPDPLLHSDVVSSPGPSSISSSQMTNNGASDSFQSPSRSQGFRSKYKSPQIASLTTYNQLIDEAEESHSPDPMRIEVIRARASPSKSSHVAPLSFPKFPDSIPDALVEANRIRHSSLEQSMHSKTSSDLPDDNGTTSASPSPQKRKRLALKASKNASDKLVSPQTTQDAHEHDDNEVLGSKTATRTMKVAPSTRVSPSRPSRPKRAAARTSNGVVQPEELERDDHAQSYNHYDVFQAPVPSPKKKPRASLAASRVAKTLDASAQIKKDSKGASKVKGRIEPRDEAEDAPVSENRQQNETTKGIEALSASSSPARLLQPSSSPLSTMPPSGQTTTTSIDSPVKSSRQREVDEQRQATWSLNRMDKLVWIKLNHQFWWPGDIVSILKKERPLKIEMLLDNNETIRRSVSSPQVALDDPSPCNILSFRTGAKVRFGRQTFIEVEDDDQASICSAIPSPDAFDEVLIKATALEKSRDLDDDDNDDDVANEEDRNGLVLSQKSRAILDDEEGLLNKDSANEFTYPSYVLAKAQRHWWPARLDKLVTKDNAIDDYERKMLGETELVRPQAYAANLNQFVQDHGDRWQSIINESFRPAVDWNDSFFAGGAQRESLSKRARFGELTQDHLDVLSVAISDWAGKDPERKRGSQRYEALSDSDRSRYRADVLLPMVVFGYLGEEMGEFTDAEEALRSELNDQDVTETDIVERAYDLIVSRLEEDASITKAGKRSRGPPEY